MKSLIQTTNQNQTIATNEILIPGVVQRRVGSAIRLNGNTITLNECGFYTVDASVSVSATAPGTITVALLDNGVSVVGATASATASAADDIVTLPIVATIRQRCSLNALTLILTEGSGEVVNLSLRVERD